ncbi:MAG: MBL fold metallo-hydrolase [Cypionkella sp.]|nr:MBL fold metallo-hydrolase [Cypionkella sp.]
MHSPSAVKIANNVLRLRALNPSALTGTGTNSYIILGDQGAVLVDAGPKLPSHIHGISANLGGVPLQAILITHAHLDHSGAAIELAQQTGAQIYSFGAAGGLQEGGLGGVDHLHIPDQVLADGAQLNTGGPRHHSHSHPRPYAGALCALATAICCFRAIM